MRSSGVPSSSGGGGGGFLANASRDQLVKHLTEAAKKLKAFERANKQLSEQVKKQKDLLQRQEDAEKETATQKDADTEEDEHSVTPQAVMLKDKLRMEVEERERWEQMAMQLKVLYILRK